MGTLPTLRERWNQITDFYSHKPAMVRAYNEYIGFTAQSLELGQFIPCNDKGEPMEKPLKIKCRCSCHRGLKKHIVACCANGWKTNPLQEKEYQKASDRVLFEGWSFSIHDFTETYILKKDDESFIYDGGIIEEAILNGVGLIPTETCKKMIGL